MSDDSLPEKMRALAVAHPRAVEILAAAEALDKAVSGCYATPQTVTVPQMVGAWAKARKLYCSITGENLI